MKIEKLLEIIITAFIGIIIFGAISTYLTSSNPILFSDNKCNPSLNMPADELNFQLQNREENTGLATVCFSMDKPYFESNGNYINKICFGETKMTPRSANLIQTFKQKIILNQTETNYGENFTINISVNCNQKIWSLIPKPCDTVNYVCIYKKEYNSYRLLN